MEKDFLPYELAVKLKALGFDEPCFKCKVIGQEHLDYTSSDYDDFPEQKEVEVLIPTFSQAFRWFREKYNLFTHIEKGENPKNFYPIIDNVSHKYNPKLWFDTYEEAELACLKQLIEIVEQKEK